MLLIEQVRKRSKRRSRYSSRSERVDPCVSPYFKSISTRCDWDVFGDSRRLRPDWRSTDNAQLLGFFVVMGIATITERSRL